MGVTIEGYKDILSITVGANETSKFWPGMLNDLKNRGIKDVLFFCVDGLPGFKDAIQAVFPNAQIQRCVIHMLRNSFKYINYKDLKKFSADFKNVYHAPNESTALDELETVKEKWRSYGIEEGADEMKYLIMCKGPNELEIIRLLLEHDKLIFTEDDLLNLVPYHARQIGTNAAAHF